MKEEVKYKLDQIANVWNYFILEYDFCKRKIKFTPEVRTNYFGDILGYFHDTFDIIYDNRKSNSFSDKFSSQISLLQSIYIQQDFVEELLSIFKIRTNKGDLKRNPDYYINRDVRNELVGHPIRKHEGKFISSCLFGYNGGNSKIVYLRYHKDNNYQFESMEFDISDIISRHTAFLNTYFDIVIDKLKRVLAEFKKQIENLQKLIETKDFPALLEIVSVFYESIFEFDYIYDKQTLLQIFSRKDEHPRYQNVIDKFYDDLKGTLQEKKEYINEVFEPRRIIERSEFDIPNINIQFVGSLDVDDDDSNSVYVEPPITYGYELGKLATRRNAMDFSHFGGCLKSKCIDNELVVSELEHMEKNIHNKIEYYSAFRLIYSALKE